MDNKKWNKIGKSDSKATSEYLNNLDNGKNLVNLIFSSFRVVQQILDKADNNDYFAFVRLDVIPDEEVDDTVLYLGSTKSDFNLAVENNIQKEGNYLSIEAPKQQNGFYISTAIITDKNVFLEDWLWIIEESNFILYQSNY